MKTYRKVDKEVTGFATQDGAGVKLTRVLSRRTMRDFDPFLMLDAFDSTNPEDYIKGFPWHPHRGIETVTYLITGEFEHGDSMGNKGVIQDGDCQWMTAGSGIIHQEMPQATEHMLGAQLWINLPQSDKMTAPKYNNITADMVPTVQEDGVEIKIISGAYKGQEAAFTPEFVQADYLDVRLQKDVTWEFDATPGETLFVYLYEGSGRFSPEDEEEYALKRALLFTDGEKLEVRAGAEGVKFLLFQGKPLKEGIAWGGPIVMNTREELDLAFEELDNDTFIKE